MYANSAHDLEDLKQNIHEAVYNVQPCELQQVSQNLFKRILARLTAEGTYSEYLPLWYDINYCT
jgi:hypothetical protein